MWKPSRHSPGVNLSTGTNFPTSAAAIFRLVCLGGWLIFSGGCASSTPSAISASGYQTIAKDPRRDTDQARVFTSKAVLLIDQSKWSDAESALQKALDADITFGPAHNNLGSVYLHQENLYQAAWEFQYAVKLMPSQPEPKNNLGLVLEAAGKLDDAIANYDQAMAIEPNNPQFVGNAARARARRGDKDAKSRDLLNRLLAIDNRPDWIQWAREKLVFMGPPPPASATSEPTTVP
jgi:Tfp pilus assembly protein PilF